MKLLYWFAALSFFLTSCATGKLYYNSTEPAVAPQNNLVPDYTVYAVGDAGEENSQMYAVINSIKRNAVDDQQPGSILFLGDNVYPKGLVKDPVAYGEGLKLLSWQLSILNEFKGRIIYLPGNHDWSEFDAEGLDAVKRQDDFFNNYHSANITFLPDDACSGPAVVELNDNVVLIIIDSQWWIQDWHKHPGINAGCPNRTREAMLHDLEELFKKYDDHRILLAMHHPLISQGPHGGHYTFNDHFFPLTKVVKWLYLPLPVIGSIYPWYRTLIGHPEDLKSKRYSSLRDSIFQIAAGHEVVFLAGHDHNLQYIRQGSHTCITSGAGSKQNGIANDADLIFGHKAAGYVQMDFYGRDILLTIYEVDVEKNAEKVVLRQKIKQ